MSKTQQWQQQQWQILDQQLQGPILIHSRTLWCSCVLHLCFPLERKLNWVQVKHIPMTWKPPWNFCSPSEWQLDPVNCEWVWQAIEMKNIQIDYSPWGPRPYPLSLAPSWRACWGCTAVRQACCQAGQHMPKTGWAFDWMTMRKVVWQLSSMLTRCWVKRGGWCLNQWGSQWTAWHASRRCGEADFYSLKNINVVSIVEEALKADSGTHHRAGTDRIKGEVNGMFVLRRQGELDDVAWVCVLWHGMVMVSGKWVEKKNWTYENHKVYNKVRQIQKKNSISDQCLLEIRLRECARKKERVGKRVKYGLWQLKWDVFWVGKLVAFTPDYVSLSWSWIMPGSSDKSA